jgi:hypothetical protein
MRSPHEILQSILAAHAVGADLVDLCSEARRAIAAVPVLQWVQSRNDERVHTASVTPFVVETLTHANGSATAWIYCGSNYPNGESEATTNHSTTQSAQEWCVTVLRRTSVAFRLVAA